MSRRVLFYAPAYARLAREVEALGGVEPVLMDAHGRLTLHGAELTAADAAVEAAWPNNDVYDSPVARNFMVATLKSPVLTWVQSGGAGLDNPVWAAIARKGAVITTTHVQSVAIADYVLWGVLDHFQQGPSRREAQERAEWRLTPVREIAGTRWLIVGFGAIGRDVAQRVRAFGASVTGVRRRPHDDPLADAMTSDWRSALPEADVVVFCLPLTRESEGMADESAFRGFKPGSVFVNVGRGGLVVEPALLAALERGAPEFAVLDVFGNEPLPADSPIWRHPRVRVTAHTAALGNGFEARSDRVFLDNLRRWTRGEPLADVAGV